MSSFVQPSKRISLRLLSPLGKYRLGILSMSFSAEAYKAEQSRLLKKYQGLLVLQNIQRYYLSLSYHCQESLQTLS